MLTDHMLGVDTQVPYTPFVAQRPMPGAPSEAMLDNWTVQGLPGLREPDIWLRDKGEIIAVYVKAYSEALSGTQLYDWGVFAEKRLSRLETLKQLKFAPEGKAERVRASLEALAQADSAVIRLSREDWKLIAEDPDLEDDF